MRMRRSDQIKRSDHHRPSQSTTDHHRPSQSTMTHSAIISITHSSSSGSRSRLLGGALLCALLLFSSSATDAELLESESEEELSPRALRDFYPKGAKMSSEKQLLGELQEVLEKLQAKKVPVWEKKYGQVPTCDVGEQCAVRKGARIGKMCDCPPGAFCNFYLLKCL